jgi:hypothetical protein
MLHRVPNPVRSLAGRMQSAASLTVWLLAAAAVLPAYAVRAEDSAPAAAADQKAAPNPDGTKEDEFAEAQRLINGPAGNAECVWLGRKAVNRLWSDDIDTAFRYIDLYDRFGCPGAHIQAAVRCIVLHQPVDPKSGDHKPSDTLEFRVNACWNNPASPAIPAATPAAAPAAPAPAPAAPAAAAPSPTTNH